MKPLGPYKMVRKASNFYFVSGLIPVSPSGDLVSEPDLAFKQVLENLKTVLNEEGLALRDIVKVNVYLKDRNLVKLFNEIYSSYFKEELPARSLVFVSDLPMGAIVEIDVIAFKEVSKSSE